jgi:ligand-binding sensor domain-containing protein/anti-sigma regulatory factor (Ser/Thr protein kinase)
MRPAFGPICVCSSSARRNRAEWGGDTRRTHTAGERITTALLLCLVFALRVRSQEQTISQMVHTAWAGRDGAPQAITALAQTPDGTLWIGTGNGLYSFDGLAFTPFKPKPGSPDLPAPTIRFLFVSKAGDLWIFGYHYAPSKIHQGQVTIYDRVQGGTIWVLGHAQQNSRGDIWAVLNEQQLIRLGDDGIWHPEPNPKEGTGHISKLFIDTADTQWVIEDNLLYRKPPGHEKFSPTDVYVDGPAKIAESPDSTLWVMGEGPNRTSGTSRAFNLQHIDYLGRRLPLPKITGTIGDVLAASDGSLWIAKRGEELQRLSKREIALGHSNEPPDSFKIGEGLSANQHSLLLDADGDVWVGGIRGLDRFAHATLVPAISDAPAGEWNTCADRRGRVWFSNSRGHLFFEKDGRVTETNWGNQVTNVFCFPDGQFYFMDSSGIGTLRDGHIERLPLLPGHTGYTDHYLFLGLVELPDSSLVAPVGGANEHDLWRFRNGKWERFRPEITIPEATAAFLDSHGRLLLGHASSDISVVRNGILKTVPSGSPGLGATVGFAETSYGVFAYGTNGIAIDRGTTFEVLHFAHPEYARLATGFVEARNRDIWINGSRGIVHIPSSEVIEAVTHPEHAVFALNLQEGDIVGPDLFRLSSSSAQIDNAGKLWFGTLNGVVSVDPEHLKPRRPPLLTIRSITADGQPPNKDGAFPPGVETLSVRYFGADFANARNVIYRYRLDGVDTAWQDVGQRSEAIYTHLRPGGYVFHVMASNSDGIWTDPVVSAPFTVLPHFYQTSWFAVLCFVAVTLFLWLVYVLRFRFVSRAIRMLAEERADERVRIARELHDTLLQGVQGLLLTFHVAAEKVPADHESKKSLEKALATADQIILEGRNRVSRLRSEQLTDSELKPSIERVAAELNGDSAIEFGVERQGGSETLSAPVAEEIFCIAREALTNAFRHSDASRIVVELNYERRQFKFACRDNGRGFDPSALQTSQKNGHWGLRGMAERAEKIGAKFSLTSSADQGTHVQVILPARRAYVRTSGFHMFSPRGDAA